VDNRNRKVIEMMESKGYLVKHETVIPIKLGIEKNVYDLFKE